MLDADQQKSVDEPSSEDVLYGGHNHHRSIGLGEIYRIELFISFSSQIYGENMTARPIDQPDQNQEKVYRWRQDAD